MRPSYPCRIAFTILVALCLPAAVPAVSPLTEPEQQQFNLALQPLGLTTEDLRLADEEIGLWGGDKYKLKMLDFLRADALRCGPYARSLSNGLLANKDSLGGLVTAAHSRLDNGIRLGLVDDPLAGYRARIAELGPQCLAVALAELTAQPATAYSTDPSYVALPQPVREAAALVLFTVPEAQIDRQLGLVDAIQQRTDKPELYCRRILDFAINTFEEEDDMTGHEQVEGRDDAQLVEDLLEAVDWNYLNRASTLLTIATQEAYKLMTLVDPAGTQESLLGEYRFETNTPLGRISLSGSDKNIYDAHDTLLLIDTGGKDSILNAGTSSFTNPIGICIDLAGDDFYPRHPTSTHPSCAAGVFGTGILLDAEGNDRYYGTYVSQGSGIFGTGVLYDLQGNDSYDSWGNSQGSGTFGTGLLADLGGDEKYLTHKYGQAYGGTRGCGVLLDVDGDDQYLANLTDHFNGGLYGPTHHVHFVQGSAYGRRADFTDGHSWSGGCGLLVDCAGDDFYEADVYGQGNAYWHAIGILVDKSGNDVYRAGQYSQASAPHFACGILQDEAGDDRYLCSIRQSLAHGRDWSIAWLEDSAGDDWYQGARTTLGVSHVNSISVFWDKLGDDVYLIKGPGLGDSEPEPNGSPRDWLLTLGLFIDGDGQDGYYMLPGDDSYEGSNTFLGELGSADVPQLALLDFAADGTSWQRTLPSADAPGYRGVGVDYTADSR